GRVKVHGFVIGLERDDHAVARFALIAFKVVAVLPPAADRVDDDAPAGGKVGGAPGPPVGVNGAAGPPLVADDPVPRLLGVVCGPLVVLPEVPGDSPLEAVEVLRRPDDVEPQ